MKDIKFILIIMLMFFGGGIMEQINDYDYNVNNTGIIYQENDNIVLNEINRTYDYNINYDLDESYLHYFPIKKSGLLDNLESKNLASPNLENKEYLGNGLYRIKDEIYTLDYNIYNGIWIYNSKTEHYLADYIFTIVELFPNIMQLNQDYYFKFYPISPYQDFHYQFRNTGLPNLTINNEGIINIQNVVSGGFRLVYTTPQMISPQNITFKLQLEKGDTATNYQVPYIPGMKIDFKGSNQVEYINPYKEQRIEIDDINNVNNIEFELLNVINPVVYNWNITTNPNMPFVRFYNDETKLLYDFTDIDEINKIGNNLFGKRSKGITAFNSALDLVNTFYTGFQKLFNNEVIDTIGDWLSYLRLGINLPLDLIRRR